MKNTLALFGILMLCSAGAVACGSDDDDSGGGSTSAALGADCEAYYGNGGCCLEVAGDQQALKDACAQGLDTINSGIANGAKPSDYEASCKAGLDGAQAAGLCK